MILVNNLLIYFEKEHEYLRDASNKGDGETKKKMILSDTLSKVNCVEYARLFKRRFESIE